MLHTLCEPNTNKAMVRQQCFDFNFEKSNVHNIEYIRMCTSPAAIRKPSPDAICVLICGNMYIYHGILSIKR